MTVVSVELTPRNPAPFGTSPLLQAFRWVCWTIAYTYHWTIAYTYHPFHRELDSAGGRPNQGVFIGASSVEVVSSRRKSLSSWSNSENLCGSGSLAMSAQRDSMRSRLSDVIGWLRFPSRPVLMALLAALTCLCADFPIVLQPLREWGMSLQAGTAATIFLTTRTGIFSK